MTYSEKLKDPRWQKKRLEIMSRDNFACTLCGDTETTLAVHHEEYKGEPWDADSSKLKTVCEHCHTAQHEVGEDKILKSIKRGFLIFAITENCIWCLSRSNGEIELFYKTDRDIIEEINKTYTGWGK